MLVNVEEFLKLKRKTFESLLVESDNINKLVRSILVISLCHDKCIYNDKEQVCDYFINECVSKVVFIPNISLDFKSKFSLIRNKLAHGDFAYDEERSVLVFKYFEQYIEINLNSVVDFANCISNYYKYLNKEYPRENLVIRDGNKFLVTDHCKTKRDYSYIRKFERHLNICYTHFCSYLFKIEEMRKKYHSNGVNIDLDFLFLGTTDEKNKIISNPYGDKLLNNMINLLNNNDILDNEYHDVCEILKKFYIFYIYPLDNFMKVDDNGIKTLSSLDNMDFSLFDLSCVRNNDNYEDVGKIKNYPSDLLGLYRKIILLENKLENLNQWSNHNEEYKKNKLLLENEINDLLKLTLSEPIKRLYDYSKNRSLIEHIRCSIMHGNYTFDKSNNCFVFYDEWKENEVYRDVVKLDDFKKIFNFYNLELIMEQDRKVNKKKQLM